MKQQADNIKVFVKRLGGRGKEKKLVSIRFFPSFLNLKIYLKGNIMKKIKSWFSRRAFIGKGGYGEIWKIAYPLMIMGASYIVLMITDRLLLAWHNTLQMSAAVPAGGLNFTLFSFYTVTINFTSALVAQYFGANKKHQCVRTAWNSFYFALLAICAILLINLPLGRWIILHSGHTPELIDLELKFFYSLQPSSCFMCISGAMFGFFSGTGRTQIIAKVNTTMCILNIVMDYALIYGVPFLGIPSMGIVGAGLATSICSMIGMIWAITVFLKQDQMVYPTRRLRTFQWWRLGKLAYYGMPSGLQVLLGSGGFTFFQFMIGYMGPDSLTTSSILISLNNLAFAVIIGFCDATGILVGQYIGRNRKSIAEKVVYSAWRLQVPYLVFLAVFYIAFPDFLVDIFQSTNRSISSSVNFAHVKEMAGMLLFVAAFSNVFDSLRFTFMGALRGSGDTKAILFIIGGCSLAIMMPGTWIMTRIMHCNLLQLWGFMVFYCFLLMALLFLRFNSGAWKNINMIKR